MEQLRDLAIVLRSVPYEERHRVITALTEKHGKISALARNSIQSRRFGGALDPFSAAEWRFVERAGADLYRVEEAVIRRGFEGLRKDFKKLALASAFNELMLRLAPEREPCPDLFRLHSNALVALEETTLEAASEDESSRRPLILLNGYLSKLIQWNGNQPHLLSCMSCRAPLSSVALDTTVSCLVAEASWVCPACRERDSVHVQRSEGQSFRHSFLRLSPASIVDFHQGLTTPIRQVLENAHGNLQQQRELFTFLEALLVYHVQGFDRSPLRSLRFLDLESSAQSVPMNPR